MNNAFNFNYVFITIFSFTMILFAIPGNSVLTPINDSNASEANLVNTVISGKTNPTFNTSIMDHLYGAGNYLRINDSFDQLWSSSSGTANVVAKFAGNSEIIGYYANAIGPTNAGTFIPLFTVSGSDYSVSGNAIIPALALFRFGLQTSPAEGTQFLSSLDINNPDLLDHMVTFFIPSTGHYVLAFEDLLIGASDRDFNDAVFEISGVSVHVPEPTTYLLMGSFLAIAALLKRRFELKKVVNT